jgi:hypothetical protein
METIKQRDVSTAQDLISAVRDRTVDRKAVVEGKLTIPIVAKMALKDASEAHILMSKGSNGKVLLVP